MGERKKSPMLRRPSLPLSHKRSTCHHGQFSAMITILAILSVHRSAFSELLRSITPSGLQGIPLRQNSKVMFFLAMNRTNRSLEAYLVSLPEMNLQGKPDDLSAIFYILNSCCHNAMWLSLISGGCESFTPAETSSQMSKSQTMWPCVRTAGQEKSFALAS